MEASLRVTYDICTATLTIVLGEAAIAESDEGTPGVILDYDAHRAAVRGIAAGPDGRTAPAASADGQVILWDLAARKEIRRFRGHAAGVHQVDLSPDGKRAITAADDDSVILWDVGTGQSVRRLAGSADMCGVAFLPGWPDRAVGIGRRNGAAVGCGGCAAARQRARLVTRKLGITIGCGTMGETR